MLPRPLTIAIAVLVTLAWAVNVVLGFIYPGRADPSLNAIFATVVGAAFALGKPGDGNPSSTRQKLARLVAGDAAEREHDNQHDHERGDRDDS